jgi:hypothetical protein
VGESIGHHEGPGHCSMTNFPIRTSLSDISSPVPAKHTPDNKISYLPAVWHCK